nr:alpha/beta hydrolase [Bacteroidota bacterium]
MQLMDYRKYGSPPYHVILIHGGPGGAGSLAPVAQVLADDFGVLEPFQTETTIKGQVKELHEVLQTEGQTRYTLLGHSWGAWLALLYAAKYAQYVEKLILVASGPLEAKYAKNILDTRLQQLDSGERIRLDSLLKKLDDRSQADKNAVFGEIGKLIGKADSFCPVDSEKTNISINYEIFSHVWPEAERLRSSGKLVDKLSEIKCPVVAIHGDYDPHPYRGVEIPLQEKVNEFTFYLLENCGHEPWNERYARDQFFEVLKKELLPVTP